MFSGPPSKEPSAEGVPATSVAASSVDASGGPPAEPAKPATKTRTVLELPPMVVTSRQGLILSDGKKEYPIEESFVSKVDETTFVAIVTASASIRALFGFRDDTAKTEEWLVYLKALREETVQDRLRAAFAEGADDASTVWTPTRKKRKELTKDVAKVVTLKIPATDHTTEFDLVVRTAPRWNSQLEVEAGNDELSFLANAFFHDPPSASVTKATRSQKVPFDEYPHVVSTTGGTGKYRKEQLCVKPFIKELGKRKQLTRTVAGLSYEAKMEKACALEKQYTELHSDPDTGVEADDTPVGSREGSECDDEDISAAPSQSA